MTCGDTVRSWQARHRDPAPRIESADTLTLDFSASKTERNKCLLLFVIFCYGSSSIDPRPCAVSSTIFVMRMSQLGAPGPTFASSPTQQTPVWQCLMPALCQLLEPLTATQGLHCIVPLGQGPSPPIFMPGKPL